MAAHLVHAKPMALPVVARPNAFRAAALTVTVLTPVTLYAQQVTGPATVIDGDSLSVNGVSIRLFGIDAPEGKQTCNREGAAWRCGEEAASQLRSLTIGHQVRCEGRGNDAYGRLVAVCSADGFELNKTMVETGWATAFRRYSEDYVGEEARAKAAGLGIWSSSFDLPEAWRLAQDKEPTPRTPVPFRAPRAAAASAPAFSGCVIKGNRNRKGQWIYHLRGFPYYEATRAEEMFCTEAEARAAGYRRAIVR